MKEASIVLDGMTSLGEALEIVMHYIQHDLKPSQRTMRLKVLVKALKG